MVSDVCPLVIGSVLDEVVSGRESGTLKSLYNRVTQDCY